MLVAESTFPLSLPHKMVAHLSAFEIAFEIQFYNSGTNSAAPKQRTRVCILAFFLFINVYRASDSLFVVIAKNYTTVAVELGKTTCNPSGTLAG